jgi:hypothetical protein
MQQDGMKLARAELNERLAAMHAFASRGSLNDLAKMVKTFQALAAGYGMIPVLRLTEALERALAEDWAEKAACCPTSLYIERLRDAIGCERADEQAGQAMIASVAVRMSA